MTDIRQTRIFLESIECKFYLGLKAVRLKCFQDCCYQEVFSPPNSDQINIRGGGRVGSCWDIRVNIDNLANFK